MSASVQDWIEEGAWRLLTVEGIDELASHDALYKLLSQHFVRDGKLPDDTASRIQESLEERLAADYDLARYDVAEARSRLDDAEALIDRFNALA